MTSSTFSFTIAGTGVAKERPRFNMKTGSVRTPEKTKNFEQEIGWRCNAAMRLAKAKKIVGPVSVEIDLLHKRSKGDDGSRPKGKSDVDNMAKGILDAMNKIAYDDDKQVSTLCVRKRFTSIASHITVSVCEDKDYE